MYCTERRNLGRQLKAMKVHHHSGGHLCISASLTQTKALQRNNPPMQENSALILFGGKSSMSSFALQASGWNLSRVKKLRISSHTIAFSSPGNCCSGQPQVTGQGSRHSENHMDQATNTLWPYTGPVPWSCPRSEAVLYRSTNYTGQSGFTAPAPWSPRAAGMLMPGKQHPRRGKGKR